MLRINGPRAGRFCDGHTRRSFIQIGALGFTGLTLDQILRAEAQADTGHHTERAVVMVYLPGGPTQYETFDPKPKAPAEIRGSFGTTATRVSGMHFCELLPKLADIFCRLTIIIAAFMR